MKRVIVGFNGSDRSWNALELAIEWCRAAHAGIDIAYADQGPAREEGPGVPVKALAAAHRHCKTACVPSRTRVLRGRPSDALATAAEDPDVILVAVGTTGWSSRSVAQELARTCPRPLLIAAPRPPAAHAHGSHPLHS